MCLTLAVSWLPVVPQWTPLGFKIRDPDTLDDISKERFEGTVLKAISKNPRKEIKKEPEEERGGGDFGQVEKTTEVLEFVIKKISRPEVIKMKIMYIKYIRLFLIGQS